jgi:N-acetylmuramoyl-L-alanine amidase
MRPLPPLARLGQSLLLLAAVVAGQPGWASSLVAWRLSRQGLELKTTPDVPLKAYLQAGSAGQGPKVWVDFPGEPTRTRSLAGTSPVREVRIGRPTSDTTRLVVEFAPGIELDPQELRLVGTSRDRWRMEFKSLAKSFGNGQGQGPVLALGEGDFDAPTGLIPRLEPQVITGTLFPTSFPTSSVPLSPSGLPVVPVGRYKVVIDPGHGGPDPGAVGIGGLRETDVVLDVCLQVAQLLQARGVQVLMTRTTEVDVDLPPRVALANSSRADAFVSVHANALSRYRPDVNGIESFYFQEAGRPSRNLAAALQQQMLSISPGSPDRGVKPARFFVIRRTVMPSTLVEMGFVTGALDAPRLADAPYRRRMALALATGILNFLQGQ